MRMRLKQILKHQLSINKKKKKTMLHLPVDGITAVGGTTAPGVGGISGCCKVGDPLCSALG